LFTPPPPLPLPPSSILFAKFDDAMLNVSIKIVLF
jgi:hypothetical protein